MAKKRFLLAFVLVSFLLFFSSTALAGCCVGIIGCSRAFFSTECSELASFNSQECEQIPDCDIVACCHNVPGIPKATYRSTCMSMTPTHPATSVPFTYIKPFTTNPAAESAYANSLCSGARPPCQYSGCEQSNTQNCMCGSAVTSESSLYCCARDNSVFPSFGACTSSPNCRAGNFFGIHGRVLSPEGVGIAGAEVRAGGKQALTDDRGNFTIELLPDLSSGNVMVIKNSTINSTPYSISGADVFGLDIFLSIVARPGVGVEVCGNGQDDDRDQFNWNSSLEGLGNAADDCDPDCNPALSRTVTKTYYNPMGEHYTDVSGVVHDLCSDHFDNDCRYGADCEDPSCAESPSCKATYCGNGVIEFPNARGQYEQCDISYGTGVGNDSLCPGKCIQQGQPRECSCQYEAVCGNGVIDEPLEDCDGAFIAATNRWDAARYNTGSDCTIDQCGKPGSTRPCQCPPPQVCGNGIKEEPEQCDLGNPSAGIPGASGNCAGCSPDCTCPPSPIVCGNNLLERGEDCDGTLNTDGNWVDFKTRKYGCAVSGCAHPRGSMDDEAWSDYLELLEVDSACKCKTQCKQSPPGPDLSPLQQVRFERRIILNWEDACSDNNARAYNVYRCAASDESFSDCTEPGSVYSAVNSAPLGRVNTFTDTTFEGFTLEEPKYYCYFVQGIYGDMITDDGVKPESFNDALFDGKFQKEIHCIRAGMEQCFSLKQFYPWADEFCSGESYNVRSTCDENNTIVTVTPPPGTTEKVDCNIPDSRGGGYVCVGPFSADNARAGKTQCMPISICDFCNDPFGLFAYSRSATTPVTGEFTKLPKEFGNAPKMMPSERDALDRPIGLYSPCSTGVLSFCYMDSSRTTLDKFYSLKIPSSCYDFNSLDACKKFNESDGNCEWAWHPLYRELGIGVCRTTVIDKQECDRCHNPLNKVFGRCDADSCALYGRCYYDLDNLAAGYSADATVAGADHILRADKVGESSFYKCVNERYISCENYDTVEDCIGSHSPYSIEAGNNMTSDVVVDVGGYMEGEAFRKSVGSNRILTPSDDFFGFGKCQWAYYSFNTTWTNESGENESMFDKTSETSGCIKNSDGSPYLVDYQEDYARWQTTTYQQSDCGGTNLVAGYFWDRTEIDISIISNISDCRKDFSSPVTNVPLYSDPADPARIKGEFELVATVYDNSLDYSGYYPDTYACVAQEGRDCYPRSFATKLGRDLGNIIRYDNVNVDVSYNFSERGFQSGRYVIRYFSEDVSHNLEEVQSIPVYIDADAPNIVFSFSNVSFEIQEDVWRTNLTMNMQVIPRYAGDDEYAFCNARLFIGDVSIYGLQDIINEYNNTWTRNYTGLPDDRYRLSYQCEDDVGNVARGNVPIFVDGDKSITNPQPQNTLNHGDLTISVETGTNAECRYLYSSADDARFWQNVTFDPAIFNTMTPFSLTGSESTPRTIHSTNVNLGNGYHRYYVKCRMFNDGRIRGNNADQMRFAVDTTPPVSQHTASATPYNGWYNRDITVSVRCGDPSILGAGLDWQFGCNSSYYCIGLGCSDDATEFRKFTSPIALDHTQYVSYYSTDNGQNKERAIEDVLFQIDKEPAGINVTFYDGAVRAYVLIPNVVYKVVVSSSKPFISPAVSQPRVAYTSQPAKFAGTISLLPTLNPSVWEGVFFIESINANKGFEGNATFTAIGVDYHNVSSSGSTIIVIDTKPPAMPTIEPSLELPSSDASAYQSLGYPVHYRNGTYYTNRPTIFVTGFTAEYLDMIAVVAVDDVDSEIVYTQTPTNLAYDDTVISGFVGRNEMKISGDITRRVNSSLFAGFNAEQRTIGPRRQYGTYGMFYDITNLIYRGGDEQYTSVLVYPGLEESLAMDKKVFFYDKESPSYWFGFDVPLAAFRNTTFYVKSYDNARNIVRYPAISSLSPFLTFFSDPAPPIVVSHKPRSGSTSRTTMDIGIVVKEGRQESGLDLNTINFSINGGSVAYLVEHDLELESIDPSSQYHRIYYPASNLANGEYNIAVIGKDLAMNGFNEDTAQSHWTFVVDRRIPADPSFSLVGGFLDPLGGDRWYSTRSPDFVVDFSAESNPVTIVDTMMADTPTEGDAANCTNTSFNVFLCKFSSPKTSGGAFWADYGVIVKAFKTLADGTGSPTGEWQLDFTVDDQAPSFIPAFQTRFMDNINLTLGAVVSNENHPLAADLELLGRHYTPIYSSNNGSFYYFVWPVPDYLKEQEGETTMTITLSDFAGNHRSITVHVYIDLTAPRVEDLGIDMSNTVKIGNELFTAQPNVTVTGRLVDEDIDKVWVMPGDFNATSGNLEGKKYADLHYADGVPSSFSVSVRLIDPGAGRLAQAPMVYNFMLINQINNMQLFVRDKAGHVSQRSLRVITDIVAPESPTFCLGEDWYLCIPPP